MWRLLASIPGAPMPEVVLFCAGNAIVDGEVAVLPTSLGPTVPGNGARFGEVVIRLGAPLGYVDWVGSVPRTIRQLNKKQRVVKPVERGLNIRGHHESVIYPP